MLMRIYNHKLYRVLCTILFALVLIGLPLTTFPLIRRLTGSMVAPFSALPLFGLLLIWLIPYTLRRGTFPKEFVPIIYFAIVAVMVSAGAYFLDGFTMRGRTLIGQSVRALFTLGIGLSFYFTLTSFMQNKAIIHRALKFIYAGGILIMIWSIFEIILLRIYGWQYYFPEPIFNFKAAFVFQDPGMLFLNRLSGFAFEPSWYVLVYNLVLFPLWLSAIFQRKSVFKLKLWFFILEDFLFVIGVILFSFSFPRIGLLALVLMVLFFVFNLVKRAFQFIHTWLLNQKKLKIKNTIIFRVILILILLTIMLTTISSAAALFLRYAGERDFRFQLLADQILYQNLSDLPTSERDIILFSRQLAFLERTVYWFGGWNVFVDYPFGVGLGNTGFYMYDRIHSLGYESREIRNVFNRTEYFANSKVFWIRLLSETGLIGFSIYIVWLYLLWRNSSFILKSQHSVMKIVGLAGQFFILAHIVEGFSVDSFAFAYPWVSASLISAGSLIVRKEIKRGEQELGE